MSQAPHVLGETIVGYKNRVTLVGELPKILRVKEGDKLFFIQDEKGNVILKNSKDVKVSVEF
jgi:bifunctional DNA-binding transcriptional regulator/antitoxin component of YhaV-PrlF toxin-antitoxin module